ncbi:uncharacterized protein LOC113565997 [Drosophila persimilis]|uniref:uncharacterized protein LOC113565997 n=1 Tax=Drosophila persimilis TaxID=7234 RepID=UPI000F081DB7|nr:uncharacterized protein LOC113565997 [Drosophila persimilis]
MCKCCRDCQLSVAMKKFAIWNVIFGLLSMDWSYRLMTTSGDYFFTAGCVHMSGAVLLIISGILVRVGISKVRGVACAVAQMVAWLNYYTLPFVLVEKEGCLLYRAMLEQRWAMYHELPYISDCHSGGTAHTGHGLIQEVERRNS